MHEGCDEAQVHQLDRNSHHMMSQLAWTGEFMECQSADDDHATETSSEAVDGHA